MYNPFPLLTPGLLKDQVARGKRYFVRQSFPRGYEVQLKAAIATDVGAAKNGG
jgi:hypothetical protein